MAKKQVGEKVTRSVANTALTQGDAKEFRAAVKEYGKEAAASKLTARKKLQELGFFTATGRLSKRYA